MQRLTGTFRDCQVEIQTGVHTTTARMVSRDSPEVHVIYANGIPLELPGSGDGGQARMKDFLATQFGEPTSDWVTPDGTFQVEGEPFHLTS